MSNAPTTALEDTPRCAHFGACGGCQHQDLSYVQQLALKRERLAPALSGAAPEIVVHSAQPYAYRNRIRLHVGVAAGQLRFGYHRAGTVEFLPIHECPIAAPLLWETAQALLRAASEDVRLAQWLHAASEVELFCDDAAARVQATLYCAPRTRLAADSFIQAMQAARHIAPQVVGAGAIAVDARTGPTGRSLASFGAEGLLYQVRDERYWISRGAFFQVNRFLLPQMVELVTAGRAGSVVWDLFSGVGLFSRVLARTFAQVTAVEVNPIALADARAALAKLGPQHRAVEATTVDFLRRALTERERPELIVLDPPRAGAGLEACEAIVKLAPRAIVYVSCDPVTLARDLGVLTAAYEVTAVELVDLFPQTSHIETVVHLKRRS